jgi:ABC-2 type transport system permease protein
MMPLRQVNSVLYFFISFPLMVYNEIYLMGIMYRHYKWSYLINAITTAGDFIWWMLLIDGVTLVPHKIAPALIGYIIWIYANYIIYDSNSFIIDSGQTGVLEQVYVSPYPFAIKLLSRFIACVVYCSLELTLVIAALMILCPITIHLSWASFIAFLITVVGIAGFALILAGVGLIFKKSQPFAYLLNNVLLFLNGSILPLEKMPHWIQIASKTLPTTQGIAVLRSISLEHQTFLSTLSDGSMLLLFANSAFYLAAGYLVFLYCERWAQRNGTLGHY